MSTKEVSKNEETKSTSVADLDMKLEVVVIPVSDVDRAKSFYLRLGWRLDADRAVSGLSLRYRYLSACIRAVFALDRLLS